MNILAKTTSLTYDCKTVVVNFVQFFVWNTLYSCGWGHSHRCSSVEIPSLYLYSVMCSVQLFMILEITMH